MLYASELCRVSVARSCSRGQAVFLGRLLHQKWPPRAPGVVRLWLQLTDVDAARAADRLSADRCLDPPKPSASPGRRAHFSATWVTSLPRCFLVGTGNAQPKIALTVNRSDPVKPKLVPSSLSIWSTLDTRCAKPRNDFTAAAGVDGRRSNRGPGASPLVRPARHLKLP